LITTALARRLALVPAHARDLVLERFRWIDGHADVWAIFRDPVTLAAVVQGLVEPFKDEGISAVCGVESRGFLLGGAAAVALGAGFIAVRKADGLFPGDKFVREASPDYRKLRHTLRLQRVAVASGDRVLLVDDWIESGSQAAAVREMVIEGGGDWAGCAVIVDQLDAQALRAKLGPVRGLLVAKELPEGG
jgi:adenine phosphoribosyltransferase